MVDLSSILPAYLSLGLGQLHPVPLALERTSADGGRPVLLLFAIGTLIIALDCARRALAPVAAIIKSLVAAAIAVLFVFVALGFVIVSVVTGH